MDSDTDSPRVRKHRLAAAVRPAGFGGPHDPALESAAPVNSTLSLVPSLE